MQIKTTIQELQAKKLFVATPMYGGQAFGPYTKSILELQRRCMELGINVKFSFLFNESLIPRARNYLVDEFLRDESMTHMIFIDADIEFNPEDVLYLLASDKPLIGAPYPKKTIRWDNVYTASKNMFEKNPLFNPNDLENVVGDYVFNLIPGTKSFKVNEPVQVMEIGTGFMMIKREAFTAFAEAYPELKYKPDHRGQEHFDGSREIHAYFDTVIDPESKRYLSEDYMFCQYYRKIGGEVWVCPWMRLSHHGTYVFRGNLPAVASINNVLFNE